MGNMDVKINGSLFGGYNKKSADAYIEELQGMIQKLREDLSSVNEQSQKQAQKLSEAENYYKKLWEHSKEQ